MVARAPLLLLSSLVVAIVALLVLAGLVCPQVIQHLEPLVLGIPTQPTVMVRHVRVLDVNSGQLSLPSNVLIENGIIEAVYAEPVPASVQIVEGSVSPLPDILSGRETASPYIVSAGLEFVL
jgi:hypothetical protein